MQIKHMQKSRILKSTVELMLLLMNFEPLGVEVVERFLQHTFRQVRVAGPVALKLRAIPELSNICRLFVRLFLGVAGAVLAGTAGPPGRASAVPAAALAPVPAPVPAVVPVPAAAPAAAFLLAAPLAAALAPASLAAPPAPPCKYGRSSRWGRGRRSRCFRFRADHHLADAVDKLTANLISEHGRQANKVSLTSALNGYGKYR